MGGLREKILSILCWNQPLKTLGIFLTVNLSLTLIVIFGLSVLSLTCYIFLLSIVFFAIFSYDLPLLQEETFQFMPREWLQTPFEHAYEFVNDLINSIRRVATWQNKLLSIFTLIVLWGLAALGFYLSDWYIL